MNLIVIYSDEYLTEDARSNYIADVKAQLPEFSVLVLQGGCKITAIKDGVLVINGQEEAPQFFEE